MANRKRENKKHDVHVWMHTIETPQHGLGAYAVARGAWYDALLNADGKVTDINHRHPCGSG